MADTDALIDFIRAAVKTDRNLIDPYLSGEFGKIQAAIRLLKRTMTTLETALVNGRAFAQKTTTAGSGASYTFTGITTDTALLVIEGISHNAGAGQNLTLEYTTNGGGAWATIGVVNGTLYVAANAVSGMILVNGLTTGRVLMTGAVDITGFPIGSASFNTRGAANPGATIDGLRLTWAAGTTDAGLVRLMTPGGL